MATGLEHTTAARAGLLYATMPLCTILIAFFFNIEKCPLSDHILPDGLLNRVKT